MSDDDKMNLKVQLSKCPKTQTAAT